MAAASIDPEVSWAQAVRGLNGAAEHGDRSVVRRLPEGILLCVIDGLGHGPEAARAADAAVRSVAGFSGGSLEQLIASCHRDIRESRGVAMTALFLSPKVGTITTLGVGNVQGMVARSSAPPGRRKRDFLLLRGGVVGHTLPPLRSNIMELRPGDTIVLATDGISIEFTTEERLEEEPQALADRILARHSLSTDDALVLVARFQGSVPGDPPAGRTAR